MSLMKKAGHLFKKAGDLVKGLAGCVCCPGGGPCTCTWPTGLASVYTVSGFAGIGACAGCDTSTDPAWDGTMNHIGAGCVWWPADVNFDPLSINGYMLDIAYSQILLDSAHCTWNLYIACTSLTAPTQTMWHGTKVGGATPAGTYNFVDSACGNTGPATLTVT